MHESVWQQKLFNKLSRKRGFRRSERFVSDTELIDDDFSQAVDLEHYKVHEDGNIVDYADWLETISQRCPPSSLLNLIWKEQDRLPCREIDDEENVQPIKATRRQLHVYRHLKDTNNVPQNLKFKTYTKKRKYHKTDDE